MHDLRGSSDLKIKRILLHLYDEKLHGSRPSFLNDILHHYLRGDDDDDDEKDAISLGVQLDRVSGVHDGYSILFDEIQEDTFTRFKPLTAARLVFDLGVLPVIKEDLLLLKAKEKKLYELSVYNKLQKLKNQIVQHLTARARGTLKTPRGIETVKDLGVVDMEDVD